MVSANCLVATVPRLSATRTVKLQLAQTCVGVPLRSPAALRVRPAGNVPAETVQV